jgi:hypothetical protein
VVKKSLVARKTQSRYVRFQVDPLSAVVSRQYFNVHGPVVDQLIDAGGPALEIQICRIAETSQG